MPDTTDPFLDALANASDLPANIIEDIWDRGTHVARQRIARRRQLPPSIELRILEYADADLLVEWLRTERDADSLRHVDPDTDAVIRRHLAWQPALDETQRRRIARHNDLDSLQLLATRTDLTETERDDILLRHIHTHPKGHLPDGTERHRLPRTRSFWTRLIDGVDSDQTDILADALLHIDDEVVHQRISGRLKELLDQHTHRHPTSGSGSLLRVVRLTISSPHPPRAHYAAIVEHPLLGELRTQLRTRLTIDPAALNRPLRHCDPVAGCNDRTHLPAIDELHAALNIVAIPGHHLVRAAVAHHDQLDTRTFNLIVGTSATPELLGALIGDLHRHQNHETAATIVRVGGRRLLPTITGRPEIVRTLARQGWQPIQETAPHLDDPADIVDHYTPARDLAEHPLLAAHIATRLAALDPATRDTVYRLLDEWTGDLPSVIHAAENL